MESVPSEAEILAGGPSKVDGIREGALLGVAAAPILPPKLVDTEFNRKRPPNQVLLSTYVPLHERVHPPTDMVAPDLEGPREIIYRWSPFNQVEPPVVHMCDLYSNYFRVLVAARVEQYSILFPVYMKKKAFQSVAEDRMLIRNHDFHCSAELVGAAF